MPFQRLKVRLKKEIVTMKVPGVDPARDAGTCEDDASVLFKDAPARAGPRVEHARPLAGKEPMREREKKDGVCIGSTTSG